MITHQSPGSPAAVKTRRPSGASGSFRPEIQALRAVAAMSVVLFHLWPNRLTGGYAGVDIFFVISGFLITAHLITEVRSESGLSLRTFWARRARRLLPASLVVLASTAAGIFLFAPEAFWRQWLLEVGAATVYVQNWFLATNAVDYWATEAVASPAQHFWSLSVEEQFYLVWPLLILGALWLGRRQTRWLLLVLTVVTAASFAYAVFMTTNSPAAAYYVTPARAWEFGVGGLLALLPRAAELSRGRVSELRVGLQRLATVAGWTAIAFSVGFYTAGAGFPGTAALLPVLGTAAVIWGQRDGLSSWRPVQWLGGISYSLYLWHWPLIVLAPFVLGHGLGATSKLAILAASIGLASATKVFVEDPIRNPGLTMRTPLIGIAVAMVAVLATSGSGIASLDRQRALDQDFVAAQLGTECFGAAAAVAAVTSDCESSVSGLYPSRADLIDDIGNVEDCYAQDKTLPTITCSFGSGPYRVALVGNSHAEMILEGIKSHVADLGWTLDTFIGRGGVYRWGNNIPDSTISDALNGAEPYDLVIVSYDRSAEYLDAASDPRADILSKAWAPVLARGTKVVAIADNPNIPQSALDCVLHGSGDDPADVASCAVPAEVGFQYHDALRRAVAITPGAALVTLDELYCGTVCPMVIGGVFVYRDTNHLTATFSKTLAPVLLEKIQAASGQ